MGMGMGMGMGEEGQALARVFRAFDRDNNGVLELEESVEALQHVAMRISETRASQMLRALVQDSSGVLSHSQFQGMYQTVQQDICQSVMQALRMGQGRLAVTFLGEMASVFVACACVLLGVTGFSAQPTSLGAVLNALCIMAAAATVVLVSHTVVAISSRQNQLSATVDAAMLWLRDAQTCHAAIC